VFEGTWEQLDDCFGLMHVDDLQSWCMFHKFTYTITQKEEDE